MYADTNSHELKVYQKCLVGMVKNGCGQCGHRTQKLTVSQLNEMIEWADFSP